jgi:carbon-monoxide dehydrogenase large subunit
MTAGRYAGQRVPRIEDKRLLTGQGQFVDDVQLPGMAHLCFVRSPFARARISGVEVAEAAALPGVLAVYTAADLNPGAREQWHTTGGPDGPETPRPPLADTEVRFVGDPVALVVAASRYVAEDAAELVSVDYDPLPAAVDYMADYPADAVVHAEFPDNVPGTMSGPAAPGLEAVFATAPHVVEEVITQGACAAVPMETRGIVAQWLPGPGEMTIWVSTQTPHEVRAFAARLLGIPEHRVRAIARDTGGGFGQKVYVQREEMCAMLAARKAGVPVKWIEDRQENLMSAGQSRHEHATAKMAFDADGIILGAHLDYVSDSGAYPTPWPVSTTGVVGMLFPGPYRVPLASFKATAKYSNTAGRSPYRGPWQFESVAREMLLDLAARQLGMDPAELRRRNLLQAKDLPYVNPNSMAYDNVTPAETFEQALKILDYEGFRREQAEARARGRYIGVGTCTYVEMTTPSFGIYATEAATIRVEPSGTVSVFVNGGSSGNSIETTVVQMVADALGVDIEDVATVQGDTAVTQFAAGTGGSRSGSMTAGAVAEAARPLCDKLRKIAAHALEIAPGDIELAGGRAVVRGDPEAGLSYRELASIAYYEPAKLPPGMSPGLEETRRYAAANPFIWTNATHLCTCEVDIETGAVTLLRYIVSEDCGPMINPNVVEGQIAGGTVQGIGGALLEHLAYDADGNPLATTFMDYLLPTAAEVPDIEYGHVETPSPGPGGYKGVGEGGTIGAVPAVVNAVADALAPFGVRITSLPVTPTRILESLAQGFPAMPM